MWGITSIAFPTLGNLTKGGDVCFFARRNGTKSHHLMYSSARSLGLDKTKTGYNLLMELKCTNKTLNFSYSHWFACSSFYLSFGSTLSLIFKKIAFCGKLADQPGSVMV